jgi:hypothetical protein
MFRIGAWIEHPQLGVGRVANIKDTTYIVSFPGIGLRNVESHSAGVREVEAPPQEDPIKRAVREVLDEYGFGGVAEIAGRWEGGEIIVRSTTGAKEHHLEIDKLFSKVVMIRDRLRVLEQKLNAHKTLTNAERADLHQYITRCYGSLTSLNFLFKNEDDKFKGSGS